MTTFANSTVPQSAARHVLAQLVDLHVPVSIEYLRGNVVLSVPATFAKTLDTACEKVNQAIADGVPPGCFS
jgi:hypothetical protein